MGVLGVGSSREMGGVNMKYDKEKVESIAKKIENGMWERDAALLNDVSETTYFRWKKEIPEFKKRIDRAKLIYKETLMNAISMHGLKSGKVLLEILRIRYPEEWNIAKKIEQVGDSAVAVAEIAITLQKIYEKDDPNP